MIERVGQVNGLVDRQVLAEDRVLREIVHVLDRGPRAALAFNRNPGIGRCGSRACGSNRVSPEVGALSEGLQQRPVYRRGQNLLLELEHPHLKGGASDPLPTKVVNGLTNCGMLLPGSRVWTEAAAVP